jgi:crotonobetainyl-CoA:carnitine CoA-transferase CaiB-like acyl-CoA transferase
MYGHVREFGQFAHLSETPGLAQKSAPRLGEHTREILSEIGYSPVEIDSLIATGKALQAADVTGRVDSRVSAA